MTDFFNKLNLHLHSVSVLVRYGIGSGATESLKGQH